MRALLHASLALLTLASLPAAAAGPKSKSKGVYSLKAGGLSGFAIARHLDKAVEIDAQSRALEAQRSAIGARYATVDSITPGSPYVAGSQRNAAAGNLRQYNESEAEAGMPIWLPGQRDALAQTVATGLLEVEERIVLRRLEVAQALRDAWWRAHRAEREAAIARNRVETARDIGGDMARRVELGEAAAQDALLAQNETLAAETELSQAEAAAKTARMAYGVLTGGAKPEGALEPAARAGDIDDHPALRAPLASLARAESQARLVQATLIDNPEVGVFARQEHNYQYATGAGQPFQDQRTDATTLGFRFKIPLPTAGRNEPRIAEAEAELVRAKAEYDRAVRLVTGEIAIARTALAAARRSEALAAKRLGVATDQFDVARKAFKLGEIGSFDLYRVRQLLLDAQRVQASAAIDVGVAQSRLNQALGYAPLP